MVSGGQHIRAIFGQRGPEAWFFELFHFLLALWVGSGPLLAVSKSQTLIMTGTRVDNVYTNQYDFLGGPRMAQNCVFWHVSGRKSVSRDS